MSEITKEALVPYLTELLSEKAKVIAFEEFQKFEKEHPNELVTAETRDFVLQRTTSELFLTLNSFNVGSLSLDTEEIKERFEEWFATSEEAHIRKVCASTAMEWVKKQSKPGDENLTFTEKFLRKVKENQKNGNVTTILNDLDLK